MATRWDKVRNDLKVLADKDKITLADIPILEKLSNIEFKCSKCKYMTDREFLCNTKDINDCRQGYVTFLNEEVGD